MCTLMVHALVRAERTLKPLQDAQHPLYARISAYLLSRTTKDAPHHQPDTCPHRARSLCFLAKVRQDTDNILWQMRTPTLRTA
jgi:hypothetical protein